MQDKIMINDSEIFQPDSGGLAYNFETTYTQDSTRTQDGVGHFSNMFTVEQLGYSATHIPIDEATKILQSVAKGTMFTLHYFSVFYGRWRSDSFYVGKGQLSIGSLEENNEYVSSLSFNMTGVNPI